MGPHTHFFAHFFVCVGVFFPCTWYFFPLLLSFVEHAKAPLNTAHSQETRRHGAFSLSLSLSSLCQSFRADERGLDASRAGPGGCGGRAVGFRARDGVFFPSGVKGSPQNRVGEDARAYLAWDVAMFEDDFPRAM